MWTHFYDMHSGGGSKEPYEHIYIEAPLAEAKVIFYNRFGHSPDRVSCTCCGYDYSVSEYETLDEAIKGYAKNEASFFIEKKDILVNERVGEIPEQGYVWVG